MQHTDRINYRQGITDGIPIALGYLAVSFTLGIAAKNAGITAFQATIMSLTNSTSAGEFAAITAISAGSAYIEIAIMQFVINLRYMLMSCALSQRIDKKYPFYHRLIMGGGITDEIFGISVSCKGKLSPYYTYGAMSVAIPAWAIGTCLGVIMGSVLPHSIVNALSVALYGMFVAIIIPPAKESRILAGVIVISMGMSYAFTKLPVVREISSGTKVIILTIVIAGVAAVLFPVDEEMTEETGERDMMTGDIDDGDMIGEIDEQINEKANIDKQEGVKHA